MSRLTQGFMADIAGEQSTLEAHTLGKKRTETTLRTNLGEGYKPNTNDELDYIPVLPSRGRKKLYCPNQAEGKLPSTIFWEDTDSGNKQLNIDQMEK